MGISHSSSQFLVISLILFFKKKKSILGSSHSWKHSILVLLCLASFIGILPSRFIHATTCARMPFLFWRSNIPRHAFTASCLWLGVSSTDGHWSWSCLLDLWLRPLRALCSNICCITVTRSNGNTSQFSDSSPKHRVCCFSSHHSRRGTASAVALFPFTWWLMATWPRAQCIWISLWKECLGMAFAHFSWVVCPFVVRLYSKH